MKQALFYQKLPKKQVQCLLCPRKCLIPDGARGACKARINQKGILYTLNYAQPVSVGLDPIEKKPLFHFLPAKYAFSVGTAGCNLACKFCQNYSISQALPEQLHTQHLPPKDLVKQAQSNDCPIIAYTYSEPTVFYEYVLDTAKLARAKHLKNVIVSNGFINPAPLKKLAPLIDAANIDLKCFEEEFYKEISLAHLKPVLKSLKILKKEGVWLEVTNLLIPSLNDSDEQIRKLCFWIKENLGSEAPLHFSRFFPTYKLKHLPPTPLETLEKAKKIAQQAGLKFVYLGNLPGEQNTLCPSCQKQVIKRFDNQVTAFNLEKNECEFCHQEIPGIF